jgi:hypothetical protein
MTTAQTIEDSQRALLAAVAALAGDPGSEALRDEARTLGSAPGNRTYLFRYLESAVTVADPAGMVWPTLVSLLRTLLAAEEVTDTLAGQPAIAPEPDDLVTGEDVLRIARVRGLAKAMVLTEGMYDAETVARLLGSASKNPREYASKLRQRGNVMALRHGNRYLFPAFQFDASHREVRPAVAEINELLGVGDDPWSAASFWFSSDPYLKGRPADVILDPDRTADVRLAAERELAPAG